MTTIEVLLVALIAIASLIPLWTFYCNEKTYRQRRKLMPRVDDPEFREKLYQFQKVDYNQHHWYLITFRDPNELYR